MRKHMEVTTESICRFWTTKEPAKIQKVKNGQQDLRDSFLAAALVGGVLFVKKTNFSKLSDKAKVFVNEPGF
jgi:hypothetical protein